MSMLTTTSALDDSTLLPPPLRTSSSLAAAIVAPSASAAQFRRSASGMLEAADAHDELVHNQRRLGTHRASFSSILNAGGHQDARSTRPQPQLRAFPTLPYYGYLRSVTLEIPVGMGSASPPALPSPAAERGPVPPEAQSANDLGSVAPALRRLPQALLEWGRRQGCGGVYAFGLQLPTLGGGGGSTLSAASTPRRLFSLPRDESISSLAEHDMAQQNNTTSNTTSGPTSLVAHNPSDLMRWLKDRRNAGAGVFGGDAVPRRDQRVDFASRANLEENLRSSSTLSRAAAASPPVWYGEYLEALTDAYVQFFSEASLSSTMLHYPRGGTATGAFALPRTATLTSLHLEWHRHPTWRDLSALFFVENGERCLFICTTHRPTQRYLTQRCEEVGVALQWTHGAVLVSSSFCRQQHERPLPASGMEEATRAVGDVTGTSTIGPAGFPCVAAAVSRPLGIANGTAHEHTDHENEIGDPKHPRRPRRCRVVDECRVLADVLLNMPLVASPMASFGPSASSFLARDFGERDRTDAAAPSSRLPPSARVRIMGDAPFLHASWEAHVIRCIGSRAAAPPAAASAAAVEAAGVPSATAASVEVLRFQSVGTEDCTLAAAAAALPGFFRPTEGNDGTNNDRDHDSSRTSVDDQLARSCATPEVPLFGGSLVSLLHLLIDELGLCHFRLLLQRFPPLRRSQPDAAAPGGNSTPVAAKAPAQRSTSAFSVVEASSVTGARRRLDERLVDLGEVGATAAGVGEGLTFSRLSSGAWLSLEEQKAVRALARELQDDDASFPQSSKTTASRGATAAHAGRDVDELGAESDEDAEAEFYPALIEYHRGSFVNAHSAATSAVRRGGGGGETWNAAAAPLWSEGGGDERGGANNVLTAVAASWGSSFVIENRITAVFAEQTGEAVEGGPLL